MMQSQMIELTLSISGRQATTSGKFPEGIDVVRVLYRMNKALMMYAHVRNGHGHPIVDAWYRVAYLLPFFNFTKLITMLLKQKGEELFSLLHRITVYFILQ